MDNKKTKDSGIEWIGEIPEDWKKNRFKYSGRFVKGKIPNTINSEGIGIPYIGASEMNSREFKNFTEDSSVVLCDEKDILILWDGANAGNVATDLQGVVSSTIVKYSLYNKKAVQRYVYYLLKYAEKYFKDKVNGTTIPHMNSQYIDDIPLLLPSMSVQENIADYLDKKCSQIDELIANNQSQIDKLKEYKQSVITQVVTKGLDPNVETKEEINLFYGITPLKWSITKTLNALCMNITDGPHTTPILYDNGIDFISAEAIKNGKIDFNYKRGYISKEFYDECCLKYLPQKNDIYMVKSGATTGKVAIVDTDKKFTIWSPLAVYRCNDKMYYKYLYYVLQSSGYQQQVQLKWSFGTQQNIGMRVLETILLPMPSIKEQHKIADYLDQKCSQIDSLIEIKQQKIEKLQEYKKSLIYEYVTGKKEVC